MSPKIVSKLLAGCALFIAADAAMAVPGWNVTNIDNTATNPTNANFITLARNPDGAFILRTEVSQTINYADSAAADSGAYHDANGFPEKVFLNEIAAGGGDLNTFLQQHLGFITIPTAGVYSFHNNTDDPFYFEITTPGGPVTWTDISCCNNEQVSRQLPAGTFPIEVIMAEFGGGDHIEFAAAFGGTLATPLAFSTTAYTLVGGPGGLQVNTAAAPEPATLGMLALGGLAFLRRRNRVA